MKVPKVFISHSSEDKDSVGTLAERLRQNNVDAWYADWEIRPGDSIVQKINQGLEECDVFVIVVSRNSVASRWVREELSSAVVKCIGDKAQIIPVRLDESPVPAVINHLHWVRMPPPEEEFNKLLKAIFGVSSKPSLGATPEFINRGLARLQTTIQGFSPEASALLRHLVLEVGLQDYAQAHELAETLDLSVLEINDGVEELEELGLVGILHETTGSEYKFNDVKPEAPAWLYLGPEHLGFDPELDMLAIAQCVVGHDGADTTTLGTDTGLPPERINIAALNLEAYGRLKLVKTMGTAPYLFLEAWATRHTRQWLGENR